MPQNKASYVQASEFQMQRRTCGCKALSERSHPNQECSQTTCASLPQPDNRRLPLAAPTQTVLNSSEKALSGYGVKQLKLTPSEPDVETLVRRIEEGDIDLQPDFQRQEVWSRPKKRKLIDTILRNWSIPPIHLVRTQGGTLDVLDGQQRLTAMRDFFRNDFSISGLIEPIDPEIQSLHGKFFRDLDPLARRQIQTFPIRCFTLTDFKPDEPSELFYRLNEPTMLTAGERRNALYGDSRDQLKKLVEHMMHVGLNKETLGFSNARLAYDDVLARLLMFIEGRDLSEKSTESKVSERFRRGDAFSEEVIDRTKTALAQFSRAKAQASSVRLNKASYLSWLAFFSRDPLQPHLEEFFSTYCCEERRGSAYHFVDEAKAVFEDRSRLRVADVASVLFRDFCLWYVYRFSYETDLPPSVPVEVIDSVYADISKRDDVNFEFTLQQRVTSESWGNFL